MALWLGYLVAAEWLLCYFMGWVKLAAYEARE